MRKPTDADGWARHAAGANGFGDVTLYAAFAPYAGNRDAHLEVRARRSRAIGDAVADGLRAFGRLLRDAYAAWQAWRAAREVYESLSELDDRMLHDLGIDRSELSSVAREATGQVEYTRAHVLVSSLGLPK
jgi:uncharacterized protein YjiS (DUF1127 family)